MRRITRRRGSGSSCARATAPGGSSTASTWSSSTSAESSSSGEPPSRLIVSATRSGCVAPVGGRRSAGSSAWPGSARVRARRRSMRRHGLVERLARELDAARPRRPPDRRARGCRRRRPSAERRSAREPGAPGSQASTSAPTAAGGQLEAAIGHRGGVGAQRAGRAAARPAARRRAAATATTIGCSRPVRASPELARRRARAPLAAARAGGPPYSRGALDPAGIGERQLELARRRAHPRSVRTRFPGYGPPVNRKLLGIYLNDHLGGSTVGIELVKRARGANEGTELRRASSQRSRRRSRPTARRSRASWTTSGSARTASRCAGGWVAREGRAAEAERPAARLLAAQPARRARGARARGDRQARALEGAAAGGGRGAAARRRPSSTA